MQKCLGIYIEDNLIKYAKVSKDREEMKVESFGIRFFESLSDELKKIIEETYSFNTPISINLANEKYLYFDIFALLNKKDIEKTVETEFESYCEEKNYNRNTFETRYALMPKRNEKEKIRALNIYIDKIGLNNQLKPLQKYKVTKVIPTSIAIANIARLNKRENQLIVNMEDTTTITTIYENQIYNVDTLDVGSKEVLNSINKTENSYAKAYEYCKNTTIYTAEAEDGLTEEQPYLQYIMPTIYKIAQEVQKAVTESTTKIQTVYLTGTLAAINNIDLYFQEFLPQVDCKLLKPKVVNETVTKINIKDYIEVNSAIALATIGLGEGIQELNFKEQSTSDKLSKLLTIEMPSGKEINLAKGLNLSMNGAFTKGETWMLRSILSLILILVIYTTFSKLLATQMEKKQEEIEDLTSKQTTQIELVEADIESINKKTDKYINLITDLKISNRKSSEAASRRNAIPNLLNQIMSAIPNKVQLTSIENTKDGHIKIEAQSNDYEQLGYFKAIISVRGILNNVVSTSSLKDGGAVTVTIEGELP